MISTMQKTMTRTLLAAILFTMLVSALMFSTKADYVRTVPKNGKIYCALDKGNPYGEELICNHIDALAQKGWEVVSYKVTNSNTKVAKVTASKYGSLNVKPKKTGSAALKETIKVKKNGKTKTYKYTHNLYIQKYVSPFTSLKINQYELAGKNTTQELGEIHLGKTTAAISMKLKKDWKIDYNKYSGYAIYIEKVGDYMNQYKLAQTLGKKGKISLNVKDKYSMFVRAINKKTGMEEYIMISGISK